MQYYVAPLEGITNYIFRKNHSKIFGEGVNRYFAPFIMPYEKHTFTDKELKQLIPENNVGYKLIPQVMTEKAEEYLRLEEGLIDLGYEEININLGCPSGTVFSKGRGSGMLQDTYALEKYLDEIYNRTHAKVSIKTRVGVSDVSEWEDICEVYSRFPVEELIIHPRVRREMYKGLPHNECYRLASDICSFLIVCNGNIESAEAIHSISSHMSKQPSAVMIGRGIIRDPSLIRQLSGGTSAKVSEIKAFLDNLIEDYSHEMSGPEHVLHKMKEIWSYMEDCYPEKIKEVKLLKKTKTLEEYKIAQRRVLS